MECTSSFLNNLNFVERRKSLLSFKTKSFLNLKYSKKEGTYVSQNTPVCILFSLFLG